MLSTPPIQVGDLRYHVTLDGEVVTVSRWTGRAWAIAAEGTWTDGRIEGCDALGVDVLGVLEAELGALAGESG